MSIHEHGFWLDASADGHFFDHSLALKLQSIFKDKRVADFGCGKGDYVEFFKHKGIDISGYDGNPYTPIFSTNCKVLDLSQPVSIEKSDWILSLEVGEHIPPDYEKVFLKNIISHASFGVILSWAVPGQGGRGHLNEKENSYIKEFLRAHGFISDEVLEKELRDSATIPWFKNTLMVFRKVD